MDKTSRLLGFLVGQQIAGMRRVTREPVAYLYNGVRLPILSAWDKKVHPYAVILYYPEKEGYFFSFSAEPFSYVSLTGSPYLSNKSHTGYNMILADGETDWKFLREDSDITLSVAGSPWELFWCSVDIQNIYTGTVQLAASDPIPVYE